MVVAPVYVLWPVRHGDAGSAGEIDIGLPEMVLEIVKGIAGLGDSDIKQ